jgi:HemY protein
MIRLVLYLLVILGLVVGLHWLADRPGTVTVEWLGYVAETSVFRALVILAALLAAVLLTWSALRGVWRSPAALGRYLYRRRQQRGLDAITGGIIAVSAGDRAQAIRYASQARKALPHEPLTHLLRAQAAQIGGDRATARRIFEAMLAQPDTEQLGLRGLFLEAEREGEREAARQFAERALQKNPKLGWPVEALFDLQCRGADWAGALATLEIARRQHLIDKAPFGRRRAVLLTAQAQALEDSAAEKALELAQEAHRLAPDLVPAAAIAGRLLASRGKTPRAARVLLKTWRLAPHPDLATAYAYARPGDSPRDRLVRVRHLARLTPNHTEAQLALAQGAIEAREWDEARAALSPLIEDGRVTPRVCTLMARIEGEQHSDAGRVREWLARAATAPRDPAWTADGAALERWSPVSPVTGALDAVRWTVPVGTGDAAAAAALAAKVEALAGREPARSARVDGAVPAAESAAAAVAPAPPARDAPPRMLPAAPVPASALPARARIEPPREPLRESLADPAASDVQFRARKPAAPVTKPVPTPASAAVRQAAPRVRKPALEPKIFVPPRAPDDPGPEAAEGDDLAPGGFSTSGAKA